jgi:hypothetical protein
VIAAIFTDRRIVVRVMILNTRRVSVFWSVVRAFVTSASVNVKPDYLNEDVEREYLFMKLREFFLSKRTWTIIGLAVYELLQFAGLVK